MNIPISERLCAAHLRLGRALARPRPADLSDGECRLLQLLPAAGVSLAWVAGRLGMPDSSASHMVKGLETRGLLARERDPRDNRRISIVLTEEGRRRSAQSTELDLERLATVLAAVPPMMAMAAARVLERLADAAERAVLDADWPYGRLRPRTARRAEARRRRR